MQIHQFKADELRPLIERSLEESLRSCKPERTLESAIRHSVFPGGKRIRPLLSMAICADLGGDVNAFAPVAVTLEIMHCASLIHDDLPALDNDDMRRGRPTCHREFGEATAILAADYMIAQCFRAISDSSHSAEARMGFTALLSRTFLDLCDGQQLDLLAASSAEDVLTIHKLKTGSLFECTCVFGALAAGVDCATRDLFSELGSQLGLAFQLCNDYDDLDAGIAASGRSVSSDLKNHKPTIFNLCDSDSRSEVLCAVVDRLEAAIIELERGHALRATLPIIDEVRLKIRQISTECPRGKLE